MATRARHFEAALSGFRDNSGGSLSGGKLQFFVPGTATAKNAYTDRDKTEAVTEVTLDSNGRAEVFGDGWYDIKLLDASDTLLATFEYVYLQRAAFTTETKTADFTASTDVDVYLVDTTNGNVTVSYPTAAEIEYPIEIAKKTADANTVIIDPYGSETINGEASFTLDTQNQSVMVISDGANLYTLGAFVNTAVTITTEATTAVKGKTRYATDAETIAETETAAAVTPAGLGANLDPFRECFINYISGLTIATDTDAEHDIAIATGSCRDASNADFITNSSVLTKQIDAAWTAGDDAGGFPSGLTLSATTWYHVFVIKDVTNDLVDAGFDTSLTASNLLADATDYTLYRRIGSIKTDGDSNIVGFLTVEDAAGGIDFHWLDPPLDVNVSNLGSSGADYAISVPSGFRVKAKINVAFYNGGSWIGGYVCNPDVNAESPSATAAPLGVSRAFSDSDGNVSLDNLECWTDTSGKVFASAWSANSTFRLATLGWHDPRRA